VQNPDQVKARGRPVSSNQGSKKGKSIKKENEKKETSIEKEKGKEKIKVRK